MSSYDLGALGGLVEENADLKAEDPLRESEKDELTEFAEILAPKELEVMTSCGGSMHRLPLQAEGNQRPFEKMRSNDNSQRFDPAHVRHNSSNRVVIRDGDSQKSVPISEDGGPSSSAQATAASLSLNHNGRLTGVYEHYLLVRPYPSLRILFTSPSMRVPGILQSPLLDRIGGSNRMREQLVQALSAGQGVTAKVKWLNASRRSKSRPTQKKSNFNHPLEAHLDADDDLDTVAEPEPAGRSRWLHCTPLAGSNGKVGVWMIVIVDDDESQSRPQGLVARPIDPPNQHRPASAMSDRSQLSGIEYIRHAPHPESPRAQMRPRRSSETLGFSRSELQGPPLPPRRDGASVTQAIHDQHSPSNQRTPRRLFNTGASASKFFSMDALTRASASRNGDHNDDRPSSRGSGKTSISSLVHAFPRPEPPLPPWPTRSDSRLPLRRAAEAPQHRAVSMIPEEHSDRSSDRFRMRDDDETSSLHSRGSAFTVKIEEE